MAYLVSRYPAVSHTFILREVLQLRECGFEIHTASINSPDRPESAMTAVERAEAHSTFFVKQAGFPRVVRDHFRTFAASPLAWFGGLFHAMKLGGTDPKSLLFHVFYFAEAVLVGRWMQERKLEHLHVHFATPAASVGLLAARTFGFTLSITVHGPDEFYDVAAYRLSQKIEAASFVCCIGRYCRSQLMKLSPPAMWNKFEIAPLGVDPDEFTPRPEPAAHDAFHLLCVGRLVPAKGQAVLVAALNQLVESGRNVRVSFAGDGPDRAALEAAVRQNGLEANVTFHGALNQDQVRALYRDANAFVLPSFAEGIPVALMEAMAMEIPCVSTAITGIPELIESGRDGILVMPSDVAGLAQAIARLMDDARYRESLALAGRRKVIASYNLPGNIRNLAGIFSRRLSETA